MSMRRADFAQLLIRATKWRPMLFDLLHNYGEEIKTVAAMATVLGVFVAALSIWISTQRARKELAVKLINDWASEYTLEMKQAFDLAEELDHSKIADISDGKSEAVDIIGAGNVSTIQRILKEQAPSFSVPPKHGASDNILLSRVQCKIIDYQWTSTLNRIEAIFAALESRAANRKLMNTAFIPLIESRRGALNKLTDPPNDYFPMIKVVLRKYGNKRKM
jgi:hypothetical protein